MGNNICVFGDSHTYGDGLKDCSMEKPWEQHSHSSWPYYMFQKKNIKNFAYPGCSNDIISLKLIRHVSKNDTALIMFTYPERLHVTRSGYNFSASHNFNISVSDNGKENWIAKQLAIKFEDKHKKLIAEYFDDNLLEILFLKNILFCQSFCISNNINYYFTMVDFRKKEKASGSVSKFRDSLYKTIDWTKIFLVDGKYGFSNYAKTIEAGVGLDNNHWDENYHQTFGKLFLKFIKDSDI